MTSRTHRAAPGPHDRLIAAYLADLEHALSGLDAGERDDVVASVHEHIDTALSEYGHQPTTDEVEALLRQLGSVDQIARDAGDGADRSGHRVENTGSPDGRIVVAVAAVALVLFWLPIVAVPLALGAGIMAAIRMRGAPRPAQRRYRIAIALSALTLLIGFLAGVGLVAGSSSGPTGPVSDQPTETVPAPTG